MHSLSQLHLYVQIYIFTLCFVPISGLPQRLHLKHLEEEQSTHKNGMISHFLRYRTYY